VTVETNLWRAGWALMIAAATCFVLSFLDSRQVTNVNTWIKPLKFSLSVGSYFLTAALLLPLSPWSATAQRNLAYAILGTIGVAYLIIAMQGARGVRSHFNISNPLDSTLFSVTGIFISLHTLALVAMLWSFNHSALPSAFLWGIRLGLVALIIGSVQGFTMTARLAHTVGARDGGPGLPFLNWSTLAGDLRIAHAVAIHGFQILPLAGWLISRAHVPRGALLVWLLFAGLMSFGAVTLLQALSGKPLIAAAPPVDITERT
jgi:hypothetical protein